MKPSPELRRDWEFYPGQKNGKIQVMLSPDQLNITLIRIQDKYVGPIGGFGSFKYPSLSFF